MCTSYFWTRLPPPEVSAGGSNRLWLNTPDLCRAHKVNLWGVGEKILGKEYVEKVRIRIFSRAQSQDVRIFGKLDVEYSTWLHAALRLLNLLFLFDLHF